jgi:hypothetical protein
MGLGVIKQALMIRAAPSPGWLAATGKKKPTEGWAKKQVGEPALGEGLILVNYCYFGKNFFAKN